MAGFRITDLRARGFEGFHTVRSLGRSAAVVPAKPGVYVVVRPATSEPEFLARSPGSWFKGKDPTVLGSRLETEWVPGAETLYIGSGGDLHGRVGLLVKFSNAGPSVSVFHWGGRLLWQLADGQDLLVAWKSEIRFRQVERELA